MVPVGNAVTSDDLGEFRLFGISPGQYYLSANASNRVAGPPPDTGEPPTYATTYFPSATDPAEAQRVSIGIGETMSDVDRRPGAHAQGSGHGNRGRFAGPADDGSGPPDAA